MQSEPAVVGKASVSSTCFLHVVASFYYFFMRILCIILSALFFACVEDNTHQQDVDATIFDASVDLDTRLNREVWICHNPKSDEHEKACSNDCYVPDNPRSFCWILKEEDCSKVWEREWQEKFCPIFNAE